MQEVSEQQFQSRKRIRATSAGLRMLAEQLGTIIDVVHIEGFITDGFYKDFRFLIGLESQFGEAISRNNSALRELIYAKSEEHERETRINKINETREHLLNLLRKQKSQLKEQAALAEVLERDTAEYMMKASAIPGGEDLERILRYHSHIDREMGRAIQQLERLQRIRVGDFMHPPLSLDVL
ncbi:MAG: hypothetical protein NVS9B15_22600 [Acidobacteriaceae bacterium]